MLYTEAGYKSPNGFEDSILMNAPDSQYVTLAENASFTIRPLRAFQISANEGENFYIEPEYHYEVVSGDSVAIEQVTNGYNVSNATVRAVKPGVSLVRVTYDPIVFTDGDGDFKNRYFNAIAPDQTGILVFNVGGTGERFDTGIDLREFDTVYINGGISYPDGIKTKAEETARYTFTPATGTSVRVLTAPENPLTCTDWGLNSNRWTSYTADAGGAFKIALAAGRNIIELTNGGSVQYHVVRARKLKINIANDSEPGKTLREGNSATLSFEGISMPLPKLAAIYNPGYSSDSDPTVGIRYQMNGELVRSSGTQYYLTQQNKIKISFDAAGAYSFTDGNIGCSWFGSPLGAHRSISPSGLTPNFSAPDNALRPFSILPEFKIEVPSNEELGELEKNEFCKLEGLYPAGESYDSLGLNYIKQNLVEPASITDTIKLAGLKYKGIVYGTVDYTRAEYQKSDGVPADLNILWRYWKEDANGQIISDVKTENVTQFPIKTSGLTVEEDWAGDPPDAASSIHGELIIQSKDPEKGYTQTYTTTLSNPGIRPYATKLKNIIVTPVGSTQDYALDQGTLKANPVTIDGSSTDLGYGYLASEKNYSYSVPYSTEQIKLKPVTYAWVDADQTHECAVVKVSVNGELADTIENPNQDATLLDYSKPIPLAAGETTSIKLEVSATWNQYSYSCCGPTTYTINVTRAASPADVTFAVPEGTKLTVKRTTGATMTADAENAKLYHLPTGEYTYTVSGGGYIAKSFPLKISGPEAQAVTISTGDLTPVPKQSGTVSVTVTGYSSVLSSNGAVKLSDNPADLTNYLNPNAPEGTKPTKCVRVNNGGYTALHAVLETLGGGQSYIDFDCRNGKLSPRAGTSSNAGKNADWYCTVNGVTVDPATTLVYDGDKIDFYYYSDQGETGHAWFDATTASLKDDASLTLTLKNAPVKGASSERITACANAGILINGTKYGTTDKNGQIVLKGSELQAYNSVTAYKDSGNGRNALTFARCIVTVTKNGPPVNPSKPGDTIAVSFRLIGDTVHANAEDHAKYVTWIATRTYTVPKDATVYDVFTRALDQAGLSYVGAENNYVRTITAPAAYGGYDLSEFTNGRNSGWMYTVNGVHPDVGLKYCSLEQGDEIVWHYVDDYKIEAPLNGVPTYKWLEAVDKDPPTENTDNPTTDTSIKQKATVSGDTATAIISDKSMAAAIEAAQKYGEKTITIITTGTGSAKNIEVTIPKTAAKSVVDGTKAAVKIETGSGSVTIPNETLASIVKQASGDDVKISVEKKTSADIAEETIDAQNAVIAAITVASNGKAITSFGGERLTVGIPVDSGYTAGQSYKVIILSADGTREITSGKCVSADGKLTVEVSTKHLSTFIVTKEKSVGFTDVKEGIWYYDAVQYAVSNGLFQGYSDTTFAPDDAMTRAMLVTVLYRMEKSPAVTGASSFADVKAGQWYTNAVLWAQQNKLVTGYNDTTFGPDDPVNREQMATILYRYAQSKKYDVSVGKDTNLLSYTDAMSVSEYAMPAMQWACGARLINGSDGKLMPRGDAQRAQVAAILMRFAQNVIK